MLDQYQTPLFTALQDHIARKVTPFHVPGHKQGRGLPELREYLGDMVFHMDVNGMEGLDFVNNPSGAILQAEYLAAQAFQADDAYMLVNGTSSGVQAMIMAACEPGSEIILPRNSHRSTIGGIILSGAIPVYIPPVINHELGMAMGVATEAVERAINEHPQARAVFLINPTYYGWACDLDTITRLAHRRDMAVLVDEAHGAHWSFHDDFPLTAMEAGADLSAVSMHKTGGSFTQSSLLLRRGSRISGARMRQVLNLTSTSSASYLLLCSLDVARRQLAVHGGSLLGKTLDLVRWAREEINNIPRLYAYGRELTGLPGSFDFDETKLGVNVRCLGYSGYQIESILRQQYNLQIELSDLYNIMALVSIGDRQQDLERLIDALIQIAGNCRSRQLKPVSCISFCPEMVVSPRDAFYSSKRPVPLRNAVGHIAGEMVMCYPPGIPVICPGELVTRDIVDYIELVKNEGTQIEGTGDPSVNYLSVLERR